jgi:hypothetical protein
VCKNPYLEWWPVVQGYELPPLQPHAASQPPVSQALVGPPLPTLDPTHTHIGPYF